MDDDGGARADGPLSAEHGPEASSSAWGEPPPPQRDLGPSPPMGPFLEADAVCAITSPGHPKTGDVGEQQARPGTAPLPAPTADGQMMLDRGPQPPSHNPAMALPPRKPLPPESARGPPRQTGLEYPKNHPKNRLPTDWKCRLAAKALALKSENAGNFLAQAVRHAWPDTREFSPAAFYNLATRKEREEYRREKNCLSRESRQS